MTHRRVYKQKLFTQRSLYVESFYTRNTQRSLYTEKLLHAEAFTHRSFYTEKPLRRLYTEDLLHTRAFTHISCYTQTLLHAHVLGILQQETTFQIETRRQCGPKESRAADEIAHKKI